MPRFLIVNTVHGDVFVDETAVIAVFPLSERTCRLKLCDGIDYTCPVSALQLAEEMADVTWE